MKIFPIVSISFFLSMCALLTLQLFDHGNCSVPSSRTRDRSEKNAGIGKPKADPRESHCKALSAEMSNAIAQKDHKIVADVMREPGFKENCGQIFKQGESWIGRKLTKELSSSKPDFDDLETYLEWLYRNDVESLVDDQLLLEAQEMSDTLLDNLLHQSINVNRPRDFRVPTYFLLGRPMAGKSTVTNSEYVTKFGCDVISIGDLGRKSGTRDAKTSQRYGEPEEPKEAIKLIKEKLESASRKKVIKCLILDGFPRTLPHFSKWVDKLSSRFKVNGVIHMNITAAESMARLGTRQARHDDDVLIIRNKFYEEKTKPVLDLFGSVGYFQDIDGTQSSTLVAQQVQEYLTATLRNDNYDDL